MLTTTQAADRLGVSVGRVHQLISDGRLPAQKVGRDYVIQDADLKLVKDRKPGRPKSVERAVPKPAPRKKADKKKTSKRT